MLQINCVNVKVLRTQGQKEAHMETEMIETEVEVQARTTIRSSMNHSFAMCLASLSLMLAELLR